MPPTDGLHNNRSRAEGGLNAVCDDISVLPRCVVTDYEHCRKEHRGNRGDVKRERIPLLAFETTNL